MDLVDRLTNLRDPNNRFLLGDPGEMKVGVDSTLNFLAGSTDSARSLSLTVQTVQKGSIPDPYEALAHVGWALKDKRGKGLLSASLSQCLKGLFVTL